MSFILNALRKSELERQEIQAESLENRIQETQQNKQRKTPRFWLVVLVFINVLVLCFVLWSFAKEDGIVVNKEAVEHLIQAPIESRAVIKNEVELVEDKNIVEVKQPNKTDLVDPVQQSQLETFIKNTEKTKDTVKQTTLTDLQKNTIFSPEKMETVNSSTALKQQLTPSTDVKIEPQSKQISFAEQVKNKQTKPKPIVSKQQELKSSVKQKPKVELQKNESVIQEIPKIETTTDKPSVTVETDVNNEPPYLSELSYEFRRKVPKLEINVYVFSENIDDRFIMINMKKYVTGQDMDSGMKLKEIRMNSLVVEYQNKVFQIKRK